MVKNSSVDCTYLLLQASCTASPARLLDMSNVKGGYGGEHLQGIVLIYKSAQLKLMMKTGSKYAHNYLREGCQIRRKSIGSISRNQ